MLHRLLVPGIQGQRLAVVQLALVPAARFAHREAELAPGIGVAGVGRHHLLQQRHRLGVAAGVDQRSEEHTSELQSLMRISYAVFCLKKKNTTPSSDQTTT